jgi:ElaB/YqjD/DUF883 family membrane-anchored ribosome-binding protein
MSEQTYHVVVTREDDAWLADVTDLPGAHTYARSLPGLDRSVREVVVLMADLPDKAIDSVQLAYDYRTGSAKVDKESDALRRRRADLADQTRDVVERTERLVRELISQGWSIRDVGALVGLSPQRVAQLAGPKPAHKPSPGPSRSRDGGRVSHVARKRHDVAKKNAGRSSA